MIPQNERIQTELNVYPTILKYTVQTAFGMSDTWTAALSAAMFVCEPHLLKRLQMLAVQIDFIKRQTTN